MNVETAPLVWWITLGAVMPLACEASNQESAIGILNQSGHGIPNGQMQDKQGSPIYVPVMAPPELAEWLSSSLPSGFSSKCPGGWLTLMGQFVPVWGASGLRVVEKTYIQAARHG